MSVNPAASGGASSSSASSSSAPAASSSAPATTSSSSSPALVSGTKTLVTKYGTVTAQGSLGVAAGAGPGNAGGRVSVAEGQVTYTSPGGGTSATYSRRVGTGEVDGGTNNADGSRGAHLKGGGALVSEEITVKSGANQVSIGVDVGSGLEASSGTRDIDKDGIPEYCIRAGSRITLGVCVELPASVAKLVKGAPP